MGAGLTVFYDADCGLCTHTVRLLRWLDGPAHLDLRPLEAAAGLPGSPPLAVLRDALHAREAAGTWTAGGAAVVRICREVAVLRPLGIMAGLPGIRRLVEPSYAIVARNRHRISGWFGLTACRIDRPAT